MCGSHISIAQAATEMAAAGVGSMGVLEEGRFVGIVTERDVLEAVADGYDVESETVRCCMTRSPDVFSPDTEVHRAAEFLLETGYRHLPVVDECAGWRGRPRSDRRLPVSMVGYRGLV
jgi:CBS domain-containing protein